MDSIVSQLQEFMETEARSCSMDYGCITPLYVYRCWGGSVAIEEIAPFRLKVKDLESL